MSDHHAASRSDTVERGFVQLARANLAAQTAEQIALAAAPIVAVFALGANESDTGWLQTAQTLPFLLLSIPAGLLVDRLQPRQVMAVAEALRALAMVLIVALLINGQLSLLWLAVLGFVAASATVTFTVAAPALVPTLVATERLGWANGRLELARTIAYAFGPAAAGVLIARLGAAPAFAITAALSAWAVVLLLRLRSVARTATLQRKPLQQIAEGIRYVAQHELLRPIFATQFVFGVAIFILQAVYVPYAVRHLHLNTEQIGFTLAAYGAGMIVGAGMAARVVARLRFGVVICIGPISAFLASLLMVVTIAWPSAWLAGLSFFLLGAGPILWVISTTTLRQRVTPKELLGRVSAINVLAYGARPLGTMIAAVLAARHNAEWCLVVAASCFAWQAVIIVRSRAARLDELP